MYRLEIYDGKDWVELFKVSFKDANILRYKDEDSIRVRDKVDGSITAWGTSYDYLLPLKPNYRIDARVYKGTDLLIETPLRLDGEWNYRSKECVLGFEQEDRYSEVLSNIDNEVLYDQGIPTENVTMFVKVNNRKLFQLRNVNSGNVPTTAFANSLFTECSSLDFSAINYYDVNAQYLAVPEFIKDESGQGNNAYMCPRGDEGSHFCWNNMNVLVRGYWVAKRDNKGKVPPILPISSDDWQYLGETPHTLVGWNPYEMGQNYSDIMFTDSIYNETDENWAAGGCSATDSEVDVTNPTLFWYLEDLLNKADPLITLDFATFLPYVDTIESQMKNQLVYQLWNDENGTALNLEQKFKLSDIINIYQKLFNVDWRLEGQEFIFRHPSEIPIEPTDYETNPNQYIDRNLSKDWSNEHFMTLIDAAIQKEKFTIGTSENAYFGTQIIDYENYNTEIIDNNDTSFETDIANIFRTPYTNDKVVILQYDNDYTVPVYLKALTGWVYNARMTLFDLIQFFYTYDRPFSSGRMIALYNESLYRNLVFTRKAIEETTINIPYNDQTMLDFDLLLKSTFGDLQLKEFNVNLNSANAQITAKK